MEVLKNISILFLSIFFESLPFLLLGSFLSACIETYISDETVAKLIPKNRILASLVGVGLGFFLPACDCAVIPVSKRLLKKKIPIAVSVSFMLASPIINPVVLLSTYKAFYKTNPEIFWYRFLFGIIISLMIGILMEFVYHGKEVIQNSSVEDSCSYKVPNNSVFKNTVLSLLKHTAIDTFEVVKYLMFGAFLASFVQVLLPRNILTLFHNNPVFSITILMLFAYLISLCSTSDSFVGKSLLSIFSKNGVIAYLLIGPMIDIKNTIVLLGNYKKSFVWTLIFLIFTIIFLISYLIGGVL